MLQSLAGAGVKEVSVAEKRSQDCPGLRGSRGGGTRGPGGSGEGGRRESPGRWPGEGWSLFPLLRETWHDWDDLPCL